MNLDEVQYTELTLRIVDDKDEIKGGIAPIDDPPLVIAFLGA